MNMLDLLESCLLDLLHELRETDVPLMVGGGFGVWLKRKSLADGTRTMLGVLPAGRSTNDLDLFLRAEVLADAGRTRSVAETLARLGYRPVEEARFMQFVRTVPHAGDEVEVKLGLLVGPPGPWEGRLRIKKPRVRTKGVSLDRHAHLVEEALGIEEEPVTVTLDGRRSTGEPYRAAVCLPQAFPYLLMKLLTFGDRKHDAGPKKDMGRHHAMNLYAIVAMMTEPEYTKALALRDRYKENPHYRQACTVVREDFSPGGGLGVVRLQEHSLFKPEMEVERFLSILVELFP